MGQFESALDRFGSQGCVFPDLLLVIMGFTTAWKRLSPMQLNIAIQTFSLIAIFFEGYDQGVMGGVNSSPNYIDEVNIGSNGTVTNTTKQGGIVSIVRMRFCLLCKMP